MTPAEEDPLRNTAAHIVELSKYGAMSDKELVRAVLETEHAEDPIIEEMMNRLDPEWAGNPEG